MRLGGEIFGELISELGSQFKQIVFTQGKFELRVAIAAGHNRKGTSKFKTDRSNREAGTPCKKITQSEDC